jgi:hypothetical protein
MVYHLNNSFDVINMLEQSQVLSHLRVAHQNLLKSFWATAGVESKYGKRKRRRAGWRSEPRMSSSLSFLDIPNLTGRRRSQEQGVAFVWRPLRPLQSRVPPEKQP